MRKTYKEKLIPLLVLFLCTASKLTYADRLGDNGAALRKDAGKIGTVQGLEQDWQAAHLQEQKQEKPVQTSDAPPDAGPKEPDLRSEKIAEAVRDLSPEDKALYKTDLTSEPDEDLRVQGMEGNKMLSDQTIQRGDLLEIIVYPQENLSSSRYVDNEGYLFFPYIGKIRAAGLNVEEFEKQLTSVLEKDYLEHPRIFVRKEVSILEEWRGGWRDAHVKPILVFTEARGNAYYATREGVSLLEVMSRQGGFPAGTDPNRLKITRSIDGQLNNFYVRAGDIVEGKADDIPLEQGDLLFMSTSGTNAIHVFGEVNRPGPIDAVLLGEEEMTLVRVLSLAGGFTRIAAANRVRIVRVVNGVERKIKVNAKKILKGEEKDIVLQSGDIVIVPESFW